MYYYYIYFLVRWLKNKRWLLSVAIISFGENIYVKFKSQPVYYQLYSVIHFFLIMQIDCTPFFAFM